MPALIVTWITGLWLAVQGARGSKAGWLHGKLLLVVLLTGVHGYLAAERKKLAAGTSTRNSTFFRIVNEGADGSADLHRDSGRREAVLTSASPRKKKRRLRAARSFVSSRTSARRENHDHLPAFHRRIGLDFREGRRFGLHPFQEAEADVLVGHFAAAEA